MMGNMLKCEYLDFTGSSLYRKRIPVFRTVTDLKALDRVVGSKALPVRN